MSLLPVRVVRLVLPYPPGVNEYWKPFAPPKGKARLINTTIGREYKAVVREMLRTRLGQLLEAPLRMDMDVFRPRRAGDVDRHTKVLFDVLQRDEEEGWPGVYRNDSQAFRLRVENWDHEPNNPRVQVTVTEDANPRQPPESWPLAPEQRHALHHSRARLDGIRSRERERVKKRKASREDGPDTPTSKTKRTLAQKAVPASYPASRRGARR
jgi:Holliday junction resolvase RusA-like endonuclease